MPWYSFFTWGWKEPLELVAQLSRTTASDYQAPTAMVDLAKPAFKLGVAALAGRPRRARAAGQRDGRQAAVRGAPEGDGARSRCTQGGKPLAGAEVAFAAVDEGLLALRDNDSWNLLDAMIQRARLGRRDQHRAERDHRPAPLRPQGGRRRRRRRPRRDARAVRHAAALEGERRRSTRNGEATIEVPLNDSLTSFRLVAVADAERAEVRHRQHQHPRHAGPAGARRPAAAGARRRPLQRDADPAQHDGARDEGAGDAAGHGQPAGGAAAPRSRACRSRCRRRTWCSPPARRRRCVWPVERAGRGVQHRLGGRGRRAAAARRTGSRSRSSSPRRCRCACCRRRWRSSTARSRCRSRRRPMRSPASTRRASAAASPSRCSRSSAARCPACAASSRPIPSSASSRRPRRRSA